MGSEMCIRDRNERAQLNSAKRIIKSQRDQQTVLGEKIKSLRLLGQTDSSQKAAANDAIRKLIETERDRQESIDETKRALQTQIDTGVRKTKELIAAEQTLDQKYDELRAAINKAFDAGKIGAEEHKRSLIALQKEQENIQTGQELSLIHI